MHPGLILSAALAAAAPAAPKLEVGLDPRQELVGVLELLGPGPARDLDFGSPAHPYVLTLRARLAPLREHRAVRLNAALDRRRFPYHARTDLLNRLGPLPDLAPRDGGALPELQDLPQGKAWLEGARAFAREPGFQSALAAARPEIAGPVERFRAKVAAHRFVERFEAFLGEPFPGTVHLVLSPLYYDEFMRNSTLFDAAGRARVRIVYGPEFEPDHGELEWEDEVAESVWREMAHAVFDPRVDAAAKDVAGRAHLFAAEKGRCLDIWPSCLKEQIARAVMLRLMELHEGREAAGDERTVETYLQVPALERALRAWEKAGRDGDPFAAMLEALPKP